MTSLFWKGWHVDFFRKQKTKKSHFLTVWNLGTVVPVLYSLLYFFTLWSFSLMGFIRALHSLGCDVSRSKSAADCSEQEAALAASMRLWPWRSGFSLSGVFPAVWNMGSSSVSASAPSCPGTQWRTVGVGDLWVKSLAQNTFCNSPASECLCVFISTFCSSSSPQAAFL